jgi:hypothetical protein
MTYSVSKAYTLEAEVSKAKKDMTALGNRWAQNIHMLQEVLQ